MLRNAPPKPAARAALRSALGAGLLALVLGIASSAGAVPVDVVFDGNSVAGDPNTNFGISSATALMLHDDLGFDIVSGYDYLGSIVGMVDVDQSYQGISTDPENDAVNRTTSEWSVDNVSGADITGASYLVFTHSDPFMVSGTMIDYGDANIGLTIDSDDGWVLIEAVTGVGTFYYPALLLDVGQPAGNPLGGVFGMGETSATFDILQVVMSKLTEAPPGSGDFYLPELQLGLAIQVVPEPATASLVALGALALAARRRRRA